MAEEKRHALLSASAAHRWLKCTAAPRFEEGLPVESSVYTEEGALAHSICELMARKHFTTMKRSVYLEELEKLQAEPQYDPEMLRTGKFYVDSLHRMSMVYDEMPFAAFEVEVPYDDWAPEGFGTADCIMFGGDLLQVVDYKHGRGVEVSAVENPQMRLYGLGALKKFRPIYGDRIKRIKMAIIQPRITEDVSEEEITVEELLAWGASIKPAAELAFYGMGTFTPGEHCRFCRGRSLCRARANINTALEEFKDCVPAGKATPERLEQIEQDGGADTSGLLTDEEVGDLLTRGAELIAWYKDLQEYALSALLAGREIPGYKCVAGRSNRAFADTDRAINTLVKCGYNEAVLYKREPLSLSEIEKLMGKKSFAEILGDQVIKPVGKPTLVPASDKRPPYSAAEADFAGVDAT